MQYITLFIAILGISILFFVLFDEPKEVLSLNESINGERVIIKGFVSSERAHNKISFLIVNNISVVCSCKQPYLGKNIEVVGVVQEYRGQKRIRAQNIKIS